MFLIFNFTRHTQQTSPFVNLKSCVSVRNWVSACLNSKLIRGPSQSSHDLSCLCVVMCEIRFEYEFMFQCGVCAEFGFFFHPLNPFSFLSHVNLLSQLCIPCFLVTVKRVCVCVCVCGVCVCVCV